MARGNRYVSSMRKALSAAFRVAVLTTVVSAVAASCGSDSKSSSADTGTIPAKAKAKAQLFPDDFQGVCNGATQSKAAAYSQAAGTHKVVYFQTYKDSLLEQSSQLPGDWTITFDANSNAYGAVDVVACAVRTSDAFVKECDGYEKDDKPTNNKVRVHTAKYHLTVREATTGKELGQTDLSGDNADCPMLQSFDGNNDTVDSYASPTKEEVVAFLKPFVQP